MKRSIDFGLLAILMAAILTGCRFGNYVETTPNPDTYSGYYEMEPRSMKLCATIDSGVDGPQTTCKDAVSLAVPELISGFFTNPVAFVMLDLDARYAAMTTPAGAQGQQAPVVGVYLFEDLTIYNLASTNESYFWKSTCTTQERLEFDGKLNQGQGPFTTQSELNLSGRIDMQARVIRDFIGTCAASLQLAGACYRDVSNCGGGYESSNQALQAETKAIFGQYVLSGALKSQDIDRVINVAYEVIYH